MTALEDTAAWAAEIERLGARLAPRFTRVEPRRRLLAYLRGLLAPVERKNGWQLAEAAGDATPDGMQDFLGRMRWDAEQVRDDLRAYLVEHLGDPAAVLVLDETGFVKKGTRSVGVQRQYSGTAGRIENCQIGVFLAYAGPKGHALLDRALYLPEGWAKDATRRARAGVPEAVTFATKPKLGRVMLERALTAGVPCAWVVGDSVYGADHALRRCVEQRGRGYVLAVTSTQRLGLKPVEDWLEDVPAKAWRRLSAGDGAKGPRLLRLGLSALPLARRRGLAEGPADPAQPRRAGQARLLPDPRRRRRPAWPSWCGWRGCAGRSRPASRRPRARSAWISTRCARGPAGIGMSRWPCWRMPISPSCVRRRSGGPLTVDLAVELVPLTVPEVRRLLWQLVWARPPDPAQTIAWSLWRRRHQQRACRCHWRRRTGHETRL